MYCLHVPHASILRHLFRHNVLCIVFMCHTLRFCAISSGIMYYVLSSCATHFDSVLSLQAYCITSCHPGCCLVISSWASSFISFHALACFLVVSSPFVLIMWAHHLSRLFSSKVVIVSMLASSVAAESQKGSRNGCNPSPS